MEGLYQSKYGFRSPALRQYHFRAQVNGKSGARELRVRLSQAFDTGKQLVADELQVVSLYFSALHALHILEHPVALLLRL